MNKNKEAKPFVYMVQNSAWYDFGNKKYLYKLEQNG